MQRSRTTVGLTLSLVLVFAATTAGEPPLRDHDIVPEDYFTIGVITGCAVSPDAKYIAYTELRWEPPAEKRNIDLWVVETKTKTVRRLTFDQAGDQSPKWSADSRFIYFTSNRKRAGEENPPYDGKKQVWRISPEGGEPSAVTRVKDGIGLFDLSSDGRTLYYTTSKEEVEEEWKDLRKEYKDLEYGHGVTKFSEVWKLGLVNWRAEKLIYEKRVIRTLAVSPDQRRMAMLTAPDEELLSKEGWSRLDVYDTETKQVETVTAEGWRKDHPSPYGWLDGAAWADDSSALAFTVGFDGYPTRLYVAEWSGDEVSLRELARPPGVTVNEGTVQWRGGSRDLCFTGEERARARVYSITNVRGGRQGKSRTLTPGDVVVTAFDYRRADNPLAIVMGTIEHPRDLFLVSSSGDYQRLTKVNPQVDTWKLPQISIVKWKGANGEDVEGILELPPDYKPGAPLPMVVELHGGPTAATMYRLRLWIYGRALMAAKGFALLSPNYRGSTGYGDKFMTDLIGRENDIEVEDILKGVDAMVERGIADPDRLAVMGWSNGGFLTNGLITKTDRFKAASSGAGVLDMVIQWGTEDTPGHVVNYMKGLPWSNPDAYRAASPVYNLDKVRTPTLIHVGGNDQRVPAANARALYRALRHYLKVPTELVVYPGEGHGLTTYENRKAKMEWDLAWFERYLGTASGEEEKEDPATD
ncbi:MAG: S9 family peptidase [Phycisphaerae bacterium]